MTVTAIFTNLYNSCWNTVFLLVLCLMLSCITYSIEGCAGIELKGMTFERSLNVKPYGYKIVSLPHPVRAGKTSERFEVRNGDCYWDSEWNDCKNDRERSELYEVSPRAMIGYEYWYGWSLFVPKDFPNIYPTITTLGQFYQKNIRDPPVMFNYRWNGLWLYMNLYSWICLLLPEPEIRDRWNDFVVNVKWSTGNDGFLRVWVNGELKVDHLGPQTRFNYPIFFKYGIYRTFISEYKKMKQLEGKVAEMTGQKKIGENVGKVPTQIVYFDEVRKGKSRESVDPSLRR